MLFIGNLDSRVTPTDIREFLQTENVIAIEEPDLKNGFAFVKCPGDDNLDSAMKKLNRRCIGEFKSKPVTVQYTIGSAAEQSKRESRKQEAKEPCQHLFVVGFDHTKINSTDLETEFNTVGRVKNVLMIKRFASVTCETVEDATKILEAYNGHIFQGRRLIVEYRVVLPGHPRHKQSKQVPENRDRDDVSRRDESRDRYPPRNGGHNPRAYPRDRDDSRDRGIDSRRNSSDDRRYYSRPVIDIGEHGNYATGGKGRSRSRSRGRNSRSRSRRRSHSRNLNRNRSRSRSDSRNRVDRGRGYPDAR